MPWRGPEQPGEFPTLGWVVLDWMTAHLPSPDDDSKPLYLTDEQARLVLRWYQIDPDSGAFVYQRGAMQASKGWGKSPLEAADALAELAGPVLFDGWDARGEPVGRPWGSRGSPPAWVQIAAVSEDQTDNTYAALYEMLVANEHRAASTLGIDAGRTRLYLTGGRRGRLEPVTASAGSREGQRITRATLDETHLWTPQNGGVKLARTLRRNLAKMGGRSRETTNAFVPGERSVAEETRRAADKGWRGIFYYAPRAAEVPQPEWSDDRLVQALDEAYGDARWIDRSRILTEIRDPATPWEDALRFYFNIPVKGAGKAIDPKVWDALAAPREVEPGTYIGLGFDGSISDDATVLRACTADGYAFTVGTWVRPPNAPRDWRVPRLEVAERVAWAFDRFKVGRMLCDPAKWWTEIEGWAADHGEDVVLALDTNQESRFGKAVDRWFTAIREGTHAHDADPVVSDHVKAAHRRKARAKDPDDDNRTLYVLIKGEDARKIDGAVADVLAHEAAMTMPPEPEPPAPRQPLVAFS